MSFLTSLFFAFFGGILPSIIWMIFWLKEDEKHPEPNKLILLTFLLGMASVPFALLVQVISNNLVLGNMDIDVAFRLKYPVAIATIVVWAATEELVKYFAAYFGGLSQKANDEPVDPIIYMITAALGFAALENTLFLLGPIFQGDGTTAFITGNMRFIGATLVHVASSAIIGIFISLSYYKNNYFKQRYLLSGFILSVALHSIFNSFIIRAGTFTMAGFALVWLSVVLIILMFETVKYKLIKK
jgi:RsiW-degrading membrane proteinase PrsW (M82 family)